VVNNGSYNSFPDIVQITVTNAPPIADAGDDQIYSASQPVPSITLDGSRSFDPENAPLTYHWRQTSGWFVQLSDATAVKPSFMHPWPGVYVFELVVNDGLQDSKPGSVSIIIGTTNLPVANAGPSRYVTTGSVTLDGTGSYDPDGYRNLLYQWRQVSGPHVNITGTNTPQPVVTGFSPRTTPQTCVFQLNVSAGELVSLPSTVTVTIVPNFGNNTLTLVNPPFDPSRPTILAFGGGNCSTGSGMTFGGVWEQLANWITVASYGSTYTPYGDMLMVYLSSVAPDYKEPIQTIGFSTGNRPAMEVAWYVNTTYKDARYAVNRVSLLDAVCNNLSARVAQFNTNRVAGEQGWVDSYISNDPTLSRGSYIPGAVNVTCMPARSHPYPVYRYITNGLDYANGGLTAFGYLSLIGSGKNYQLNTAVQKYYYVINSSGSIVFFNQSSYPGRIMAPVQLTGPTNGDTITASGAAFGCQSVENAVGYQLLFGSDPHRVMDFATISDTTNPPSQTVTNVPLDQTWWTVRAYDQFGSTIYADPWLINRPANRPPVADPGPDRVAYAGLDGTATVTFDGSKSSDPDGDALSYTWALVLGGNAYLSNGVTLTLQLPVGVYTIQLMVNDGRLNSQPVQVTVTVVAPLECQMKIAPSAINLGANGPHILARIQFPQSITGADVQSGEPLQTYPGGIQAMRLWTDAGRGNQVSLFAFFGKDALSGVTHNGPTELTVTGKLRSGQVFFGRDTIKIIGADGNDSGGPVQEGPSSSAGSVQQREIPSTRSTDN
jgi:hypothetical protein